MGECAREKVGRLTVEITLVSDLPNHPAVFPARVAERNSARESATNLAPVSRDSNTLREPSRTAQRPFPKTTRPTAAAPVAQHATAPC